MTSTDALRRRPIQKGSSLSGSPTPELNTSTPVLLLGGADNSVSICRHLGRRGITIKVSGNPNTCWGLHSRYCREQFRIPQGMEPREYWAKLLLSPGDESLRGHVVFACNDEGVEFLAKNRDRMLERYLIPDFVPELQLALLDKQKTLELARSVGVPVPQFWNIKTIDDVKRIRSEVKFPVMVKPIHSHRFQRVFNKKLFVINESFDELVAKAAEALRNDLEIMVVEMIPGPDSLLCSQFSYFDANGNELYNYTKRVIRRYPVNSGPACYHITEWIPEVNELARKLLKGINFRGLANPEFKRDTRDGKLKVIEVNIRFTAVHELLVRSGLPLDLMVYCHLTRQPLPEFKGYAQLMRMWEPMRDFRAYRQLSSRGELTFAGWLRSVLLHRKIFPVFRWSDPWPSLVSTAIIVRSQIRKIYRKTK